MCACTCSYVCAHVELRNQHRVSSSYYFPPSFLRQGPSLKLELTIWARQAGQGASGIYLSPPPTPLTPYPSPTIGTSSLARLLCGCRDLNLDPYACPASTLLTEQSFQTLYCLFPIFMLLSFIASKASSISTFKQASKELLRQLGLSHSPMQR